MSKPRSDLRDTALFVPTWRSIVFVRGAVSYYSSVHATLFKHVGLYIGRIAL